MIEGYKTVGEIAEEWGVNPRTIQIMCADEKIEGAVKFGRSWAIPVGTERPGDGREKTGKYKGWRKETEN